MAKIYQVQTTFGRGELQPEMALRRDTQAYVDGLKTMRNMRALGQGGASRRPGTWRLRTIPANSQLVEFDFANDQRYLLVFSNGAMDAYAYPDMTSAGGLTSCPWSAAQVAAMTWTQQGDVVILSFSDLPRQVVRRTGSSSWQRSAFAFEAGAGSSLLQPYYKFAADTVTLTPSARSGAITLTTSAAHWVAGHVGTRIRWAGREVTITSITNSTVANGTVVEKLPPTQKLTKDGSADTDVLLVGQVVEGEDSGARGLVVSKTSSDVTILLYKIDKFWEVEKVIGPDGKMKTDGRTDVSPGATKEWEEQLESDLRGYCGVVGFHGERLLLGGHPLLPNAVLGSRVGGYFDFETASPNNDLTQDDDPFFELVSDAAVARVQHFVSTEQLLVFTSRGPFYVPESDEQPLSPTTAAFRRVGAEPVGGVRPGLLDEGVLFVEEGGLRVSGLSPTGNVRRPWEPKPISTLSSHLIRSVVDTAYIQGLNEAPERYAYMVNGDGTMAVLHSLSAEDVSGMSLWETDGLFKRVAALGYELYAAVERSLNDTTVWCLERFDLDLTVDCAGTLASSGGTVAHLANEAVRVIRGTTEDLGAATANGSGVITVDTDLAGPFVVGLPYAPTIETLPPEVDVRGQAITGRRKRIASAQVHILDSCPFAIEGQTITAHPAGVDPSTTPPRQSGPQPFTFLGWKREPTLRITQDACLPLKILGISMMVAV